MAIDIECEDLITLKDACKHRAFIRNHRPINLATLRRYVLRGSRGVILETIRTPAGLITSRQAIVRFIERLSDPVVSRMTSSPSQCAAAHRHAEAALAAEGI